MYEKIIWMIDKLVSSRQPLQDTLSDLEDIRDHIEMAIDMINNDLAEG
jgi:hypothetical protein